MSELFAIKAPVETGALDDILLASKIALSTNRIAVAKVSDKNEQSLVTVLPIC